MKQPSEIGIYSRSIGDEKLGDGYWDGCYWYFVTLDWWRHTDYTPSTDAFNRCGLQNCEWSRPEQGGMYVVSGRHFPDLVSATRYAGVLYRASGIVMAIEEVK